MATHAWENNYGGSTKDEIYVYRKDGRLAAFYPASNRIELMRRDQYGNLRAMLKALDVGKVACDADNPCADDQWCRKPELSCAPSGFCAPQVDRNESGSPQCPVELYPQPICGCDNKTYASRCVAAAAGVSVFEPGHCLE